jgi:hypothetical protein
MRAILLLTLAGVVGFVRAEPVQGDFSIRIDPARRTLAGEARLRIDGPGAATLRLGARFRPESATMNGQPLGAPMRREETLRWELPAGRAPRQVELQWSGDLEPLDARLDQRQTLENHLPVTGAEGTFLPADSGWYPAVVGQLFRYRLTLSLPAPQRGLVAGRLLREDEQDGMYRATFDFVHPAEGMDLMAGPYTLQERSIRSAGGRDIRLRTYFHPRIAELAAGYLDALKGYIDLYEGWIGAYPFSEFSVVSSPTPTGLGMPTLTYLGVDVLRLPFIKATSLGHEVLHNWWGNGVYPDYARGNWSEGLTTFMADYAYQERAGAEAARQMRLSWLRDFAAIPPGQDGALQEFTSRTHGTSQIVGYHKAAMVFFMLRDRLGPDPFVEGIRRFWEKEQFHIASWQDLQTAYEVSSGQNLGPFFEQWLSRPGAPEIAITQAESVRNGDRYRVRLRLTQRAPPYRLRVPVTLQTERGDEAALVELVGEATNFEWTTPARPKAVVLDPDFRLFRRLGLEEASPILRDVMVAAQTATLIVGGDAVWRDAAALLAREMLDYPAAPVSGPQGAGPVLLIGLPSAADGWLAAQGWPARPPEVGLHGSVQVWAARRADGVIAVVVSAKDAGALAAVARALPHYGRQSYLVFDGDQVVRKGIWPARPLTKTIAHGARESNSAQ